MLMMAHARTTRLSLALIALVAGVATAQAQSRNCIDTIAGIEGADRFVGVASRTHVAEDLRQVGPFTIFVPTDAAIAAVTPALAPVIFPDSKSGGGSAPDPVLGPAVVNAHILEGRYTSSGLKPGESVTMRTRAGTQLVIANVDGTFLLRAPNGQQAKVISGDRLCSNGVVHIIDHALVR